MTEVLTMTIEEHVATVTLNRPAKHNAINFEMFAALAEAGEQLKSKPTVRAVVLNGAGDNFCSGIDTSVFKQAGAGIDPTMMAPVRPSPANFFQRPAYVWRELGVPVICALQGAVYGGGLQIALGADLRFAGPSARLSIMEIKWGLIPDLAISTTLRDILRLDQVKELAWSGRVVDAAEALELGLVTAVHDDPFAAAQQFAAEVANKSPDAIQSMKKLVNQAWQMSDADALALEAQLQSSILGAQNQVEAAMSNLEGRDPVFEDRNA